MMEFRTRWLVTMMTGIGQVLLGLSLLAPPVSTVAQYVESALPFLSPDRTAVVFLVTGGLIVLRRLIPAGWSSDDDVLFVILSLPLLFFCLAAVAGFLAGAVSLVAAVAFGMIYAYLLIIYFRLNGGAHGT
jgi:hypothetical protein